MDKAYQFEQRNSLANINNNIKENEWILATRTQNLNLCNLIHHKNMYINFAFFSKNREKKNYLALNLQLVLNSNKYSVTNTLIDQRRGEIQFSFLKFGPSSNQDLDSV